MYNFSSKLWFEKRRVSKSGEASIYLQVTLEGKHDEFALKLRWPADKIDTVNGTLLPRRKQDPDVSDYNLMIMIELAKHTEILRTYRIKNAPLDIKLFAREVRIFDSKESFVSFMRRDALSRKALKEISKRTWQNHMSTLANMVDFDQTWNFTDLTKAWMDRFKLHLVTAGFEPGGIWTNIKFVKTYLQRARLQPMLYVDERVAAYSNPEPKWSTNFLSRKEVNLLIQLYKEGNGLNQQQMEILKAFLFTCFTSLRISDVYRVNGKWRLTEGFLDFIPKKNETKKKWIHIPIMPVALSFVRNTTGRFFELPTEQQYNKVLKTLAASVGILKPVTSHYGRHTFGHIYMTTVGNLKGLQEILGHAKIETTMRYAHLDDEYKTESVQKMQDEFPELLTMKKII